MAIHYSHFIQKTVIQKLENRAIWHNFMRIIVGEEESNIISNNFIIR